MLLFRNKCVRILMTSLAGLVFLNMSFFMAELSALDFKKNNKPLYEVLVKTFTTICEEEKDPFGGESSETESAGKELDLELSFFETVYKGYSITILQRNADSAHYPCDGTSWCVHQPPEQA